MMMKTMISCARREEGWGTGRIRRAGGQKTGGVRRTVGSEGWWGTLLFRARRAMPERSFRERSRFVLAPANLSSVRVTGRGAGRGPRAVARARPGGGRGSARLLRAPWMVCLCESRSVRMSAPTCPSRLPRVGCVRQGERLAGAGRCGAGPAHGRGAVGSALRDLAGGSELVAGLTHLWVAASSRDPAASPPRPGAPGSPAGRAAARWPPRPVAQLRLLELLLERGDARLVVLGLPLRSVAPRPAASGLRAPSASLCPRQHRSPVRRGRPARPSHGRGGGPAASQYSGRRFESTRGSPPRSARRRSTSVGRRHARPGVAASANSGKFLGVIIWKRPDVPRDSAVQKKKKVLS